MSSHKYILGVDEAGRGPLAGPVTVAAVLLPRRFYFSRKLPDLRDSKKLTKIQREEWFSYIEDHEMIFFEVSSVTSGVIDRINIAEATNLAATRAVERLVDKHGVEEDDFNLYVDGRIKIGSGFDFKEFVKGDERINAIKLASVAAKVTRDRKMDKFDGKYEKYGFKKHKGYGTAVHKSMIQKHGPSVIHRLTFLHD